MRYTLLLLGLFTSFAVFANGFYENSEWRNYPYQDPASKIEFPKDEGTHHIVKGLEWWYVVVHAVGEATGDKYSILVTHFNNQVRLFNVTNITKKTHISGSSMGILKSAEGYLDLTHQTSHGVDQMKSERDENGKLIPFQYRLTTHYKDMLLDASISANKKPMMVGLDGFGPVGSSGDTWYYSLTSMSLDGVLSFQGVSERIHGQAWMDHQWGPFWVSPIAIGKMFESYEWFSVQLDNGTEIMISNIYNRARELPEDPAYGDIQLFDRDGNSFIAQKSEFKRVRYWQDPISKKFVSMGWTVKVPEWDLDLTLTPEFEEQMVRFPLKGDFWEGSIQVSGLVAGAHVQGKAFGELVHSFETPKVEFKNLKSSFRVDEIVDVSWILKNRDAGNPLHYKLFLVIENRPDLNLGDTNSQTNIQIDLSQFKRELDSARVFQFRVKACSVDEVICGQVLSPKLNLITSKTKR